MGADETPALPSSYELRVPAAWKAIEFISDLHLCEDEPLTVEAWASFLARSEADAVFLLGDLFEVWVGDDACDEPGSFEARCAEVLADASSRRHMAFMAGNRDFLVGSRLLRDCGVIALPDPSIVDAWGQRVLLTHGDALCLSDVAYQQFRREVRSNAWREAFLARPLAERRRVARQMRDASDAVKRGMSPAQWSDVDTAAAVAWLHASGCRSMIHGHTHRPGSEALAPGYTRHVLSDWDLADRPPRAEVLRLTRNGFQRRAP